MIFNKPFKIIKDIIKTTDLKRIINKKFSFYSTNNTEELKEIYKLRYKVYCLEKKFIDCHLYNENMEFDGYDLNAIHLVVRDKRQNKLVGTLRLIRHSNKGLPIEKDFGLRMNLYKRKKSRVLEASRLVILSDYRKKVIEEHLVLLALIKLVFNYCSQYNYNYLVAVVDNSPLVILQKLGLPIKILGKSKFYMGSESTPILIDVKNGFLKLKKNKSVMWRFLKD